MTSYLGYISTDVDSHQALHLSYHPSEPPPKELYVIVRVYKVRTSPAYSLYCDPHRLFYKGGLRVASGIEVNRGPVQPVEAPE